MKEARFDRHILTLTLILVSVGLVAIYSASFIFAMARKGNPNYFLWKQMLFVFVGIIIMFIVMKIPLKFLLNKKILLFLYILQVFSLILVFFFPKINGAYRWIQVGGFSLQPSEFAKITAILITAHFLSKKRKIEGEWYKLLLQISIPLLLIVILILFEKDYGMCVLIMGIVASMIFIAGIPIKKLLLISVPLIFLGTALVIFEPYRMQRLRGNPESDPQNKGFQIRQSLIAVGSGGISGKSLGGGIQKRLFLPLPHTDFIFANIAEEGGFIGSTIIIGMFLWFGYRAIKVLKKLDDSYHFFIAFGITVWIIGQSLIHIGVNIYAIPPKGVPLPLISYGGSSMLSTLLAIGILLNISREAQ
mgnify:CR=1 FL=1